MKNSHGIWWDNGRFVAGLVAVVTLLVYGTALVNGFVNWDDDFYVLNNPTIRSLNVAFFRWAFTDLSAGFWHPLTWLSYALDYGVWGLKPLGYHLTAIILHGLNSGIVVLLVKRILEASTPASPDTVGISLAAGVTGLLFGIHPLHVESVAWVSERKDLLCGLFFLLSCLAYVDYRSPAIGAGEQREDGCFWRNKAYLLSLCLFLCALASKTMAVSLPVVLLILDRFLFNRLNSLRQLVHCLWEKLPFIAASFLISLVSISAQRSIGAMPMMTNSSLVTRVLVACRSFVLYLWKMLVPLDLLPYYPYPQDVKLLSPEYGGYVFIVLAIAGAVFLFNRSKKAVAPCWMYYSITLLPVLGLVQVGTYAMADRFTYLPSVAPLLLVGLLAAQLWQRGGSPMARRAVLVGFLAVFIILSWLTLKQIGTWKSSIVLWSHVIGREPARIPTAYLNRGVAYGDEKLFDKAIADFTTAISLDSAYVDAYLNRGLAHVAQGDFGAALGDYDGAVAIKPGFADAYVNRGNLFFRLKEYNRALPEYNRAISLQPELGAAYVNRAALHRATGSLDDAIADYGTVLRLNPEYAAAHIFRGELYLSTGKIDRAMTDFHLACQKGLADGCKRELFPFPVK